MYLICIIPGIYLQPLIDDLKLIWQDGVQTYDLSRKKNFTLRESLLWTINNFLAYGMLSGWHTSDRLECSICMEVSKAFYLKNNLKISYFD